MGPGPDNGCIFLHERNNDKQSGELHLPPHPLPRIRSLSERMTDWHSYEVLLRHEWGSLRIWLE